VILKVELVLRAQRFLAIRVLGDGERIESDVVVMHFRRVGAGKARQREAIFYPAERLFESIWIQRIQLIPLDGEVLFGNAESILRTLIDLHAHYSVLVELHQDLELRCEEASRRARQP